ncbi:hypothetical protein [Spirosoma litoris]
MTLVSAPDLFALTKGGRMLYQFTGSGRNQTTGVKSVAVLFVSGPVTAGTLINIRWKGQTQKLVFTASPEAANEFASGSGNSAYVDALIEELKGFYPFREDFIISRYDPTQLPGIVFTAKTPSADYNLSLVNPPVGSPFTFGNTTQGAEPLLRIQYSVYVEAWLQKPGTDGSDLDAHYTRIYDAPIETDADGSAQFDIGNILHSELVADWPQWNLPTPVQAPNSHRKYYLAYGEAYGSPLQVGRIKLDSVRHAYLGGADYVHRAGGGYGFLALRNSTVSDDAALRFGPLTRFVRTDEPQYLTFLNSRASLSGVRLKIIRTFDNDQTDTLIESLSAQEFPTGAKITYCVGPTQQDLINTLPSGRTLKEYSVQLVSSASAALSVVYRFILNYDYQPYTRYFVYLSSLGVPDVLTTFGKGSAEIARFYEQAERFLSASYEIADGQFADYNVATQRQWEVTTGFRSKTELLIWDDFYRSPVRFQLLDGKPLPISITSKSIKEAKEGETLWAHLFEFIYHFQDAFYTASTGEVGNTLPPLGFVSVGNIIIEPQQIINSVDDTVPDIVRTIDVDAVNSWNLAAAWGNPETKGFLTQTSGNALYRRGDVKVPYTDLVNTPTTRDQAGLHDVATIAELFKISSIKPRVLTWSDGDTPAELL